jgi:hypothetical protein
MDKYGCGYLDLCRIIPIFRDGPPPHSGDREFEAPNDIADITASGCMVRSSAGDGKYRFCLRPIMAGRCI